MIKENFFYTFFEGGKKTCTFYICCGLNLSLLEYFSSQLDFYSKLVEKGKKNSNYKIHGLYYALNIQWTAGDITTLWFILIWAKWVCFTVLLSAEVLSRTQSGSIVWRHPKKNTVSPWSFCEHREGSAELFFYEKTQQ